MLDEMWAAPPEPLGHQGVGSEQSWPTNGQTSFREVLHSLNPLQHLPVIGTIYRAITGDTIPEPVRVIGSVVVGFLTGGPVGVATGLLGSFAEAAFHRMMHPSGEAGSTAPVAVADASQPAPAAVPAVAAPSAAASAYARADRLAGCYGPGAAA